MDDQNSDYVLTLSNNKKYVVVSALKIENKTYLYLINIDKNSDFIFGELIEDEIKKVEDKDLLVKLATEFDKVID